MLLLSFVLFCFFVFIFIAQVLLYWVSVVTQVTVKGSGLALSGEHAALLTTPPPSPHAEADAAAHAEARPSLRSRVTPGAAGKLPHLDENGEPPHLNRTQGVRFSLPEFGFLLESLFGRGCHFSGKPKVR